MQTLFNLFYLDNLYELFLDLVSFMNKLREGTAKIDVLNKIHYLKIISP